MSTRASVTIHPKRGCFEVVLVENNPSLKLHTARFTPQVKLAHAPHSTKNRIQRFLKPFSQKKTKKAANALYMSKVNES